MNENRCVCCGEVVPEGRMVCPVCENNARRNKDMNEKQVDKVLEIVGKALLGELPEDVIDDLLIGIGEKLIDAGPEFDALSGDDARAALGIVETDIDDVDE